MCTLQSEYRALSEQTGEVVEPHNIVKYFACGGRQVCFSAADMTDIKSLGQGRGMKLLGFKPQRLLPLYVCPPPFTSSLMRVRVRVCTATRVARQQQPSTRC